MKISQKFLAIVLPTALVPLLAVCAFSYFYSVREFKAQISERIEGIAAHQKQRLVILNDHNLEVLAEITTKLSLRSEIRRYNTSPGVASQAVLTQQLVDFARTNTQLYCVSVADPSGKIIASTDPGRIGRQLASEEVFRVGSQAATTSIFFKTETGAIREYLAAPFQLENKFIGVAVLETSPSTLRAIIQDYSELGQTGETFLARAYPDNTTKYLLPLRFQPEGLGNLDAGLAERMRASGSGLITATDYRGHSVLMAVHPVERTDWRLVVKIDEDEALKPVYSLGNVLLGIFMLVTLIAVLTTLWVAEIFTRPIRSLTAVVQKIQAGNLGLQAPVRSSDEIGILSGAFNSMTGSLLESRALLMASVLSLRQGFILVDNAGVIQTMNQAALRLLGLSEGNRPSSTLGEALDGVKGFDPRAELAECIKSNRALEFKDIPYRSAYFHIYLTPVNFKGEAHGAVVLIADITEEKILQRSRDEFFSIASHELRTPLTAIMGNTSIIKEYYWSDLKKPELKEMIDDMSSSSRRLIGLVNDFLDASRLELGRFKYVLEPVDLLAVAKSVQKEYHAAGTLQHLYLNITEPVTPLPPVFADANRVKQIMINLVGNALKFTKEGGITISFDQRLQNVEVSVTDTGQGISEEGQRMLFHKFQQAGENLLTRDGRGTGLGLYISRLLTDGMGGSIRLAKSELGKGTTFAFRLPIASQEQINQKAPVLKDSSEPTVESAPTPEAAPAPDPKPAAPPGTSK